MQIQDDIFSKAYQAYVRYCIKQGLTFQIPENHPEGKRLKNGRIRFDFTNCNGVLATFEYTGKRVVRVSP